MQASLSVSTNDSHAIKTQIFFVCVYTNLATCSKRICNYLIYRLFAIVLLSELYISSMLGTGLF